MRGALERADEFADFDVLLHGEDVGAGDHDVADTALAQPQDVLEHPAFFRRAAGFAGRLGVEHVLEIGARVWFPAEQRTKHARHPAFAAFARRRHWHRQMARLVGSGVGGTGTWAIAIRHGGQASRLRSRARWGSGICMRIMILLSSPSISSACASTW